MANKIYTVEDHIVLGAKGILISLIPFPDTLTTTEEGIIIPLYENFETDGGRPDVKLKIDKYSTTGKVLQISAKAQEILNEEKMDIKVGDLVTIPLMQKHPSNQFLPSHHTQASEFEGYLLLRPDQLQSKLKSND